MDCFDCDHPKTRTVQTGSQIFIECGVTGGYKSINDKCSFEGAKKLNVNDDIFTTESGK